MIKSTRGVENEKKNFFDWNATKMNFFVPKSELMTKRDWIAKIVININYDSPVEPVVGVSRVGIRVVAAEVVRSSGVL